MKKYFILMVLGILSAAPSFAQSTSSKNLSDVSSCLPDGLWFSYGFANISLGGLSVSGNELGISYSTSKFIAPTTPIFLEFTPEVDYMFFSKTADQDGLRLLSLGLPVNIGYSIHLKSNITLNPFFGLKLKANLWGKERYEAEDGSTQSLNIFDNEAVRNEYNNEFLGWGDASYKRIQLGWQMGIGANISHLYLGISYHKDITPFFTEKPLTEKLSFLRLTVGYNF